VGSLRQAIADANAHIGADTITFTVVGTINVITQLPSITNDGTTIDGNTAPGFAGTPIIILHGPGPGGGQNGMRGLQILSSGNVVRGLDVESFGVGIEISGGDNNRLSGLFIFHPSIAKS
jgi:hypothetical protein